MVYLHAVYTVPMLICCK